MRTANTKDKDDFIVTCSQMWLDAYTVFEPIYDQIEKGYKYLMGDQYTEERKKWYTRIKRPYRSFNHIFPIVNAIFGDFLLNDQRIKIYPLPGASPRIAKIIEDILDVINQENDHIFTLGRYALAGFIKQGFIRPEFNNERHTDGGIFFSQEDETDILWDPVARDYFLQDADWWARSRFIDKEELLNHYPEHRENLKDLLVAREENGMAFTAFDQMNNTAFVDERYGRYRIIEFNYRRWEEIETVTLQNGANYPFNLSGKKADLFLKLHPDAIIEKKRDLIKYTFTYIPSLMYVLEDKKASLQDRTWDLIPFFPFPYGKKATDFFGIVKNAAPLQDDLNSWANMGNAFMAKLLDPGTTRVERALVNEKQIKLASSIPGIDYIVKAGHRIDDAIKLNPVPNLPFAPEKITSIRTEQLDKIMGFTPNLQGRTESSHENASLFVQRVKQARTALYPIKFHFSQSKRRFYNKTIRLIQQHYGPDDISRTIGVVNIDLNQYGQGFLTRYEVTADDMEQNPSAKSLRLIQKTEIVRTILEMFQGALPLNPQTIILILKFWLKESDVSGVASLIEGMEDIMVKMQQETSDMNEEEQAVKAEALAIGKAGKMLELLKKTKELNNGY